MYYLARANFSDSVIFYQQEFTDNKVEIFLWKIHWDQPLKIRLNKVFNGTLYDIKPISDNVLYLVGNSANTGADVPKTDENPAAYGPLNKIVHLENVEWKAEGIDLDDYSYQVHTHQDPTDHVSKFHLRDLIAVNRYNKSIVWEVFDSKGLYIDVFAFHNAEKVLEQHKAEPKIKLEGSFISQQINFAPPTRPENGVVQNLYGAYDGSYIVGYKDNIDSTVSATTKNIKFAVYHFVEHATAVEWLAEAAQLGTIFEIPGITKDVAHKVIP